VKIKKSIEIKVSFFIALSSNIPTNLMYHSEAVVSNGKGRIQEKPLIETASK
jgi:hypothetical protein